jgi:hypothetical protein
MKYWGISRRALGLARGSRAQSFARRSSLSGWQDAQYTFTAPSNGGNVELYDFYVDPRCSI